MKHTAILPASAMATARSIRTKSDIQGLNYSQIPGSASAAAAAPDGSLWVLSNAPAGSDKYIWHYVNGSWTNISGLASHIATAPDGTLYALNSGGGTYRYSAGTWTALGGGASSLTVGADGSIYVMSNGTGPDQAIWHNVNGSWSQVPGSGVTLAASWDVGGPYNVGSGTIRPGGFYILNSSGAIWYENVDGSFANLPGNASAIVAAGRGVFALGYPADPNGNQIYYYDLDSPGWSTRGGSAVSISADTNLFAIGAAGGIYSTPITARGSSLPVRGLWVQFERRGSPSSFWDGEALQKFNDYDTILNSTVRAEAALQLDKMRAMGVNTIEFELRAADSTYVPNGFTPPGCNIPPVLGLQYPQPTATELANLSAFFDLVNGKGMKVILNLVNTHMEEQPPANNTTWITSILQTIKNHPALSLVSFDGDVHVNNFNNTPSCGSPAEPPLWLGFNAAPAQYVKWALQYANSLGIPYNRLTAESVVGDYNVMTSPNLTSPIVVMKQIFDTLNVPDAQRTYGVSFYEHNKCLGVQGTCADEDPNTWARDTMQFIFSTIGHNGAHAVAIEYGNNTPVSSSWSTASAADSLLTLMEQYGMDGGCFWRWTSFSTSEDADPTLADPVKRRGVSFSYNPVASVLAKHYTAP